MSEEIYNFISIKDYYTKDIGKINLKIDRHDLYLDDKLIKKNEINIKISSNDLIEIITHIYKNNRYIIHIVNLIYDSSPLSTINNIAYLNYYKTIIIDNCGNVYIGGIIYNDIIQTSFYPMKTSSHKNIKLEYPDNIKIECLPDFLILLIKNINASFMFKSFDYTSNIIEIITNITDISYYFIEFKNEHIKNIELLKQKNDMLINMIDTEIFEYKVNHENQVKSLHDIIHYLENENIVTYNTLKETTDKNTNLTDRVIELTNINKNLNNQVIDVTNNNTELNQSIIELTNTTQKLTNNITEYIDIKIELNSNITELYYTNKELQQYKNNFIIYFIVNFWRLLTEFVEKVFYINRRNN